jgi:hypothetical protein
VSVKVGVMDRSAESFCLNGVFTKHHTSPLDMSTVDRFLEGGAPEDMVDGIWESIEDAFTLQFVQELSSAVDRVLSMHKDTHHQFWNALIEHGFQYQKFLVAIYVSIAKAKSSSSNEKNVYFISQNAALVYLKLIRINGNSNIFHSLTFCQVTQLLCFISRRKDFD